MTEKTMSFEEAFAKLGEILQKLEAGDLPLSESLALYEEGVTLAKYCNTQLDAAELKVKTLSAADDDSLFADD